MAVTQTQIDRLRRDVGGDETSLPDETVQDIFDEAEETYSDAASALAQTRILALQGLLASAAKMADYTANESSEKRSQVYSNLSKLLDLWQKRLDDAVADADVASLGGGVRFGRVHRKPARVREYPGGL